jgi:uncharacterized protein YbjT (DUF2867 family)
VTKTILVTGATGNVGSELVKNLHRQGHRVRATVLAKSEETRVPDADIPWVRFDFGDQGTYREAFAGVDRLFLMRPPAISDINRYIRPAIAYAGSAGVRQITFLSLVGAEKNRFVPHAKVEALLKAADVHYTMLRCGFFMQNLSTTHAAEIRDDDEIFVPAGRGKTAFIDVRDIAAVAARTLTETGHENKVYTLTGSEALDYEQVADIMSEVLGRKIRYANPSLPRFAWRLWRRGYPLRYVGVVSAIYTTTRFGLAETVAPDTGELLGRAPIRLRRFVEDYRTRWHPAEKTVSQER